MTTQPAHSIGSHRLGAVLLAALLLVGLLPGAVLAATTVTSATGGGAISADTAANATTPAWTTLTGPSIAVTAADDIDVGEIVLTAPAGFNFDAGGANPSVTVGSSGAVAAYLSRDATTVTFNVTTANTGAGTVTISGVRVRPTVGGDLASGEIEIGGSANVTDATAGTLAVVAGAPVLTFATQPSAAASGGTVFAQQPIVESQDQFDNPRVGDSIILAIKSGTPTSGGPGALTCTATTVATAAGDPSLATFAACKIDKAGDNYKLRATVSGGTAADSTEIDVAVGAATQLVFTSQPSIGFPGSNFATQPVVAVQDAGGNTVTGASTTVTLSETAGTAGTLTCTGGLSMATTSGVASFSGCDFDGVGVGAVITADETGALTTDATPAFDIVDRLIYNTQPAGAVGGVAFTTQPVISVRAGASTTGTNNDVSVVTLALSGGTAGAVLTCTANPVTVVDGVATFAGCKIDKVGTYTLIATSPSLTSATSSSIAVTAGSATKVGFTAQPNAGVVTQAFPIQPVVAIQDTGGNTVTTGASSTLTVTLAIGANPGGGVLTCTGGLTKVAVAGLATFAGCAISAAGVGYTLVASATGMTSATGTAFTVTAPTAAITLTNTASVITWGGGVSLNVQFGANGANKAFILEGARDGVTFVTIANLVTNASGFATFPYTPVSNLFYRVRFLGTSDLLAANSNTTRTVVRQIAILRPTNHGAIRTIARNASVTFTTTVRPARADLPPAKVTFVFYKKVSGVWTLASKRDVYIDGAGKASWTWKFSTAGSWYVRSIANPTTFNANSVWSQLEFYTVR